MISTRCCTPTGRSSTSASGSTSKPNRCGDLRARRARAAARSRKPADRVVCSWPSMTFSATVKTGMSMKCWWTMPMPAAIASPGPAKCWTRRRAGSRPRRAGRGRRARSSASTCRRRSRRAGSGSRRARPIRSMRVVGDQGAEALGDAAQFELHGATSSRTQAAVAGRTLSVPPAHPEAATACAAVLRQLSAATAR